MLFAPDQLNPDSSSFDATNTQLFNWRSNGDPQTHYRIKIYNNDTNNLVYDSTKIASTMSQHLLPSNTLSNGLNYKYQLQVFNNSISALSDYIFFKTNNKPVLTLNTPSIITTRSFNFKGSYSQAQNIPFNRFKFIFYDSNFNILVDSGWKYGYNIEFEQDGFKTDEQYFLELITESQYSMQATTGKRPFNVSYTQPNSNSFSLTATPDDDSGSVLLKWSPLLQITGTNVGSIEYVAGKFGYGVHLNTSSKVIFNSFIPINASIMFWVSIDSSFIGQIISLGNDEVTLGYNGSQFYLTCDGNTILGKFTSVPNGFFKVLIKPDKTIIQTSDYTEYL